MAVFFFDSFFASFALSTITLFPSSPAREKGTFLPSRTAWKDRRKEHGDSLERERKKRARKKTAGTCFSPSPNGVAPDITEEAARARPLPLTLSTSYLVGRNDCFGSLSKAKGKVLSAA